MLKRFLFVLLFVFTCAFILTGCGQDGSDGADGTSADTAAIIAELQQQLANGTITIAEYEAAIAELQAAIEAAGKISSVESCDTCHAEGSVYEPGHSGKLASSGTLVDYTNDWTTTLDSVTMDGTANTATILFTVTSTGDAFSTSGIGVLLNVYDSTTNRWSQIADAAGASGTSTTITATGTANQYQAVVTDTDITTTSVADDTFMIRIAYASGENSFAVVRIVKNNTIYAMDSDENPRNLYSDNSSDPSCAKCHGKGEFEFVSGSHAHNPYTMPYVTVDGDACQICHIGASTTAKNPTTFASNFKSALVTKIHGIHAADGAYSYTSSYEVDAPSNMSDCSVCHTTDTQLANAVDNTNFTFDLCATCHGDSVWDSDPIVDAFDAGTLPSFHKNYTSATDCQTSCHDGASGAAATVTLETIHSENTHNMEVSLGKDIAYVIDSVSVSGSTGTIKWQATKSGVAQNVLSTSTSAPVFNNINSESRGGKSYTPVFRFGFYTGDDITNQGNSTQGGQPTLSVAINATTTVASSDTGYYETTFTIPSTVTAENGVVILEGVPVVWATVNNTSTAFLAIVDSVSKNFKVSDGSDIDARREVVDMELCKSCHTDILGHGHSRVNSIETCVLCHNPNATDASPRTSLAALGYDTSADGKTQQSYDLKVMIHNIHSTTFTGTPYFVYRSRGIYAFYNGDDSTLPSDFGTTGDGSTSWNKIKIQYPRSIASCNACHINDSQFGADQSKAIPVTVDQGDDLTTHDDDTVIGPNAAACTSCHKGSISDTVSTTSHTRTFGYYVKMIKEEILALIS